MVDGSIRTPARGRHGRISKELAPLANVMQLRDTRTCNLSLQVQNEIVRYCANTNLVYFLRTMPPSMTIEAAQEHDRLIASAFHRIVGSEAGSPAQCERALRQARLPVKLGGLGLTSMAAIRRAAWVGTWALVWTPLRQLHAPFRAVDITAESAADFQQLSIFTELQDVHTAHPPR